MQDLLWIPLFSFYDFVQAVAYFELSLKKYKLGASGISKSGPEEIVIE